MRYLLQRTRFLEQMAGPRDDFEFFLAGQLLQSALVELDDDVVVAADDQKNRGFDACEGVAGEIRAAAAGDDGADALPARSSGDERGSGARAGAEVADSNIAGFGIGLKPIGCAEEAFSQESDIEAEICRDLVHALLLRREQIDEKCGEACALEHMGHVTVARAEAAAAPLPCAKRTIPAAPGGMVRSPASPGGTVTPRVIRSPSRVRRGPAIRALRRRWSGKNPQTRRPRRRTVRGCSDKQFRQRGGETPCTRRRRRRGRRLRSASDSAVSRHARRRAWWRRWRDRHPRECRRDWRWEAARGPGGRGARDARSHAVH